MMDNRYEIANANGMSREFIDWFFDNKKSGCGNAWFIIMAGAWEGWQAADARAEKNRSVIGFVDMFAVMRMHDGRSRFASLRPAPKSFSYVAVYASESVAVPKSTSAEGE